MSRHRKVYSDFNLVYALCSYNPYYVKYDIGKGRENDSYILSRVLNFIFV